MNYRSKGETVLAVFPTSRGFGFVVTRSALSPIDWGTRGVRGKPKNAICIQKIAALIELHQPDAIIMEDPTAPGSHRSKRIKDLSLAIARLADAQSVDVHVYPRSRVKEFFAQFGARTRRDVATAVANQITALERFLPSPRHWWQQESPRMSIFNAAALAMVFLERGSGAVE